MDRQKNLNQIRKIKVFETQSIKEIPANRDSWIDVARILAVLLVVWAHLVDVSSYDRTGLKTVFGNVRLPIYETPLSITPWENFLFIRNSSAGSAGVALFFLTSGYLMASMSQRYSRSHFLLNRAFRIFPCLWIYVLLMVTILWKQNVQFSLTQVITNLFLVYSLMSLPALLGITWTLTMEGYFYLLTSAVGKWSTKSIYAISTILFLLLEILSKSRNFVVQFGLLYFEIHSVFMWFSFFSLIMLIGAALQIAEKKNIDGLLLFIYVTLLCLVGLNDSLRNNPQWLQVDWSSQTIYAVIFVFIFLRIISKQISQIFSCRPVRFIGDCVYPIYLFHIPVGIGSIIFFRNYIKNGLTLLAIGFILTIVFSIFIHFLVEKPGIALGRSFLKSLGAKK